MNKTQRVAANPVCSSEFAISSSPAEMNSHMDCVNEARKCVVMEKVAVFITQTRFINESNMW